MSTTRCKSCTMPIDSGDYCQYCTDESGVLRGFQETLARFVQFARRKDSSLSAEAAEAQTRAFMSNQEAWKDHPDLNP